jgi:hypothetical protein
MATNKTGTAPVREGSEAAGDMTAEFERVDQQLRALVKERPVLALLSAVAAGYLAGRIMRRRG